MPASNRDWREIENDREKYAAYLCSREWAVKKEAVRERSGGICERCKLNPMDACHHLTYKRKYDETLEDLQAICHGCHEFTHGKSDVDPAAVLIAKEQKSEWESYLQIVCDHNARHGAKLRPVPCDWIWCHTNEHWSPILAILDYCVQQEQLHRATVEHCLEILPDDMDRAEAREELQYRGYTFLHAAFTLQADDRLGLDENAVYWLMLGRPHPANPQEYRTTLEAYGWDCDSLDD